MKSATVGPRLLITAFLIGLIYLLEVALGLGKFLFFFLGTSLIWLGPYWLRWKIYQDRSAPQWQGNVIIGLIVVWLSLQAWFIRQSPHTLLSQQRERGEFLLLTLPTIVNLLGIAGISAIGATQILAEWKPRYKIVKLGAGVVIWVFIALSGLGAMSR
jgi:hypothetical protein